MLHCVPKKEKGGTPVARNSQKAFQCPNTKSGRTNGPKDLLQFSRIKGETAEPGARANTRDWVVSVFPKSLAACGSACTLGIYNQRKRKWTLSGYTTLREI